MIKMKPPLLDFDVSQEWDIIPFDYPTYEDFMPDFVPFDNPTYEDFMINYNNPIYENL